MKTNFTTKLFCVVAAFIFASSCSKPPVTLDYQTLYVQVIGRENCKGTDADDYWLLDLSVFKDNPSQYGDTVTFQGKFFTRALKVRGLDPQLRYPGAKISIDFKQVSADKVISTGCTVSNPTTFPLKEITILNQEAGSF